MAAYPHGRRCRYVSELTAMVLCRGGVDCRNCDLRGAIYGAVIPWSRWPGLPGHQCLFQCLDGLCSLTDQPPRVNASSPSYSLHREEAEKRSIGLNDPATNGPKGEMRLPSSADIY